MRAPGRGLVSGTLAAGLALALGACGSPESGPPIGAKAGAHGGPSTTSVYGPEVAGACDGYEPAKTAGDQACVAPPLLTPAAGPSDAVTGTRRTFPAIEALKARVAARRTR